MLTQISVKNFRTLKNLSMMDLKRINLITGLNGSGKTSLLETAFLLTASGKPQFLLNPNVVRGTRPNAAIASPNSDGPWKEIFSNLDQSNSIEIAGKHQKHGSLKLRMELEGSQTTEMQLGAERIPFDSMQSESASYLGTTAIGSLDELTLKLSYIEGSKSERRGRIQLSARETDIVQPTEDPSISSIYLQSSTDCDQESAIRLGKLRLKKRSDFLLEVLQAIEPRLRSVEDSCATGLPTIVADIGLEEMVPLALLGNGITRIARLAIAIASVPDGMVFMDEIDGGLHHSVLPDVWKAVGKASSMFNAQVVGTTQSLECIVAAHRSLDSDSFRLHRLESNQRENRCATYNPESIGSAVEFGMEVR